MAIKYRNKEGNLTLDDISVNHGGNDTDTNFAVGIDCLVGNNSGLGRNVGVGYECLKANTEGYNNVALGYKCLNVNLVGNNNVAIGFQALDVNEEGNDNVAIGLGALGANVVSGVNVAIGSASMSKSTLSTQCVGVGAYSLYDLTEGDRDTAVGYFSLNSITLGEDNSGFGSYSLLNVTSGNRNSGVGHMAGSDISTGSNNICLGDDSGTATSPFNITTEDNRIVLGDNDITNAYIKVAWTVTSDARDKADVEDLTLGLNYIEQLRPITFKWDDRSKYWEKKETTKNGKRDIKVTKKNKDGSKKETKINVGLLAQEVLTVEDSFNLENNLVVDAENEENLKIKETALIPILIKAVQELSARVKELEDNK